MAQQPSRVLAGKVRKRGHRTMKRADFAVIAGLLLGALAVALCVASWLGIVP